MFVCLRKEEPSPCYLKTQVTVAFWPAWHGFQLSSFFQFLQSRPCQSPSAPSYRSAPHWGEEPLPRVCSQRHSPTSQRPTVPPSWGPKRILVALLCAMWVLWPTEWLGDPKNVCLWLDSVLSVFKWWVDHSYLPATISGKKNTLIIFLVFWGWRGWRDRKQNTLGPHQDCVCLCVWNLMRFARERKQDYHYILRTKISEKSVSSFWLSSIGRFREKNEIVMWSASSF